MSAQGMPPRVGKKLRLNTLPNTRAAIARVAREWYSTMGNEREDFRTLVYVLNALVNAFKVETDVDMAERLERVETALEERQRGVM